MIERRAFLGWVISGVATLPLRGVRLHAQAAALPAESITTLRVLAPIVLPSELGAAGHGKVVNDFVQWLASYRAGAERSWGYGTPRKTGTPTLDASRYADQLRDLERAAKGQGGMSQAVTSAIELTKMRDLPSAPNGQHVVTDFMSYFYSSGQAHDLAYRASIRRGTCRGLAGSSARPTPLTVGD